MIPKHPSKKGERDKAGEAIDVRKTFDFCHADIVTEFRSSAISIFSGFFQGIRAMKGEIHPLNSAMNLICEDVPIQPLVKLLGRQAF